MSSLGFFGIKAKTKYKSYKGDMHGTCKNLLLDKRLDYKKHKLIYDRKFDVTAPNQKWGTDVTEFHIASGKLYLSLIIDFYTREIISFDVSISPNFRQIANMLHEAFERFSDTKGIILHSDWIRSKAQCFKKKIDTLKASFRGLFFFLSKKE